MIKLLLLLVLGVVAVSSVDVGEELLKREIIKKVVEFTGIEMPSELHLLCLPCKLVIQQARKFSQKQLINVIRKEWLFFCPKFKDPAFCEGINQTFIDQFSVHFFNNYFTPSNACQSFGVCKKEHEAQTIQDYINEVMADRLSKEQQKQWQEIAESRVLNKQDYTVVQFADLHVDVEYSVGSNAFCDAPFCCREENGKPKDASKGAQYWGTYSDCDLPFRTVQNLIQFAGEKINPDFIIWTGDSTSHDIWHQQQWNQTLPTRLITDEIKKYMPNSQLYAIYGNHEAYPADQYDMIGEGTQWLRDEAAEMWKQYLTQDSYYQLRRNGYYSQVDEQRNLKVIALNSQACDSFNFYLMDGITDPRGMLKWLISELKQSEDNGQFAIIFAHIPPGDTFCNSQWADRFSVVIERFEHVVTGIFYGHTHQDHVQHIRSKIDGRYVKTLFIAPSGTTFSYQNPSFRVFQFNGLNNQVKDYTQYRLNLEEANKLGAEAILDWVPVYNFLEYYGLQSASLEHVSALPYRLAHDDELLKKYIYNYATGSEVLYQKHLKNLKSLLFKKGTKKFFICGAETAVFDEWYDCVGLFEKFKETSFFSFKLLEQFSGKWLKE